MDNIEQQIEARLNELSDDELNKLAIHLKVPRAHDGIQAPLRVKISDQQRMNFVKWVKDTGNIQKTGIYLGIIGESALPKEELSKPKENNQEFGHDTIKTSKPWYKRIWAIVAGLIIFLAALTTLILNLDKIKEKVPQNDFNKTNTETKTDKKVEDITLLYLFENDFNNLLRAGEDRFLTDKEGSQTIIKSKIYLDFETQTEFVGFYIPSVPETFDICTHLAENYKTALELTKKVMVESSSIGLQPVNTSELKFSGRVFIYHEYPLLEAQKRELFTLYKKHDLSPQFRGTTYLFKKKQIEKSQ